MAFDTRTYEAYSGFPAMSMDDQFGSWTTTNVLQKYKPGTVAVLQDPCYGIRYFKLVKNMDGSALTQGHLVANVAAADVGTITAGTTTSITTSGLTANDLEWQMIICTDDAGAAGAAPEGESSLCVGNTTTEIYLHQDYAFTAAIAASDTCSVNYVNGIEQGTTGDLRGTIGTDKKIQGIAQCAASDNYWLWILQRGWARVMNLNALTANTDGIHSATAGLYGDFSSGHETVIGQTPVAQFAGGEESFATVYIDCIDPKFQTGSP